LEESTPEELERNGRLVKGRINGGQVSAPPAPVSQEQIKADRYTNPLARGMAKIGFPGTANAIQGGANELSDAYRQGGLFSAIGAGTRGALGTVVGVGDDVLRNANKALEPVGSGANRALDSFDNAINGFYSGLTGGTNDSPSQTPAAPAASSPTPAQAPATASAPAPAPAQAPTQASASAPATTSAGAPGWTHTKLRSNHRDTPKMTDILTRRI
jgi:hypothetical protein